MTDFAEKYGTFREKAVSPPVYPVTPESSDSEADLGTIEIHNAVIANIARLAALKVEGVIDTSQSLVEGLAGIVGMKSGDKGVGVQSSEGGLVLEVNIILRYGVNIPKVAWQIQNEVRTDVERMTSRVVKAVNVVVQGVAPEPRGGEARP